MLSNELGGTIALNSAWGTTFWSQRRGTWDEILPPTATTSHTGPSQKFDIHHSAESVSIAARGHELFTGTAVEAVLTAPAGHARVVREDSP